MDCRNYNEGHKKFMYVKQELLQSIQQNQTKVLINPNFVNPKVVKPHFNKHFLANQTIHVNPNVIKNHEQLVSKHVVMVNPTIREKTPPRNHVVVSTPTKIVRSPKGLGESSRNRRISIHTQYKIIRGPTAKTKLVANISPVRQKNCFTIDRRLGTKKMTSLKNPNVYTKNNVKINKSKYVRISRTSETKRNSTKNYTKLALKLKILTIRGQKYKLDSSHHTLTLIENKCDSPIKKPLFKTIYVGGVTFKQKEPNVFVKTKVRQQHLLLRQAKQKSLNTLTNKLRKSNLPCPLYHRFGKCKGRETGKCIRLHNPEQISLCPTFIQGACTKKSCLLSHKISAEKMPTCKFFLEGLCSKDDCPYLHVKISSKAEVCKDFLEGFCRRATECDKRHQYLCSDFEKTGNCVKKNCPYPHGNMVRAPKFTKLIIKKLQGPNKQNLKVNKKPTVANQDESIKKSVDIDEKILNIRYYNESQSTKVNAESSNSDPSNCSPEPRKRPKLGSLPSFIPFVESPDS